MVLYGTQALGAVLWGVVAGPAGLTAAFLLAAGVLAICAATIVIWPFIDTPDMDRSLAVYWPEPQLAFELTPNSGPVMVTTMYTRRGCKTAGVSPRHETRSRRSITNRRH
jgi:Transmembrane secretion effector